MIDGANFSQKNRGGAGNGGGDDSDDDSDEETRSLLRGIQTQEVREPEIRSMTTPATSVTDDRSVKVIVHTEGNVSDSPYVTISVNIIISTTYHYYH